MQGARGRLPSKAQQTAVCVEPIGAASHHELEPRFFAAIDQPLAYTAINPEHDILRIPAEAGD
jgi:hypothetical protein